nr:hypothetical protein [Mannheimia granulomatis]
MNQKENNDEFSSNYYNGGGNGNYLGWIDFCN